MARVVSRVDVAALVTDQLERALQDAPTVAALPGGVRDGLLREGMRAGTLLTLAMIVEQRECTPDEVERVSAFFLEIMAVWGVTMDDVLTTWAIAGAAIATHVLRQARPEELPIVLDACGRGFLFTRVLAVVATRAAVLVDDERVDDEREARAALAGADRAAAAPAQGLGADRLAVVHRPGASASEHAEIARTLRRAAFVAATASGHVEVRVPAGETLPALPGAIAVLEAQSVSGSAATRIQRLREVADVARLTGRAGPLSDRDLLVERLLRSAPEAVAALRHRLARVSAAPSGAAFLVTARAFVAERCDIGATAAALGLHRETVRHRIRRFGQLSRLDLGTWRGRCGLLFLLAAAELPAREPHEATAAATPPAHGAIVRRILARLDRGALAADVARVRAKHVEVPGGPADDRALADLLALVADDAPYGGLDIAQASTGLLGYVAAGASVGAIVAASGEEVQLVWQRMLDAATEEEKPALRDVPARLCSYLGAMPALVRERTAAATRGVGRAHDALLAALLEPELQLRQLAAAAAPVGLRLSDRRRPASFAPVRDAQHARKAVVALRGLGWIASAQDDRVLALVPADTDERTLLGAVPEDAAVALGAPAPLEAVGAALRRTGPLADAAARAGVTGIVDPLAFPCDWLLQFRPDLAEALRSSIVEPLRRHDGARGVDLVTTLVTYLDCDLRRRPTATALHLHPNSVDYRLRVISGVTGLAFDRPQDVLVLSLAATATRLTGVA